MRARSLLLEDFRSYPSLELQLSEGVVVFVGPNRAGKTNLLEALLLLALGTSPRATDDSELVRWGAPYARVRAEVTRSEGERRLEALVFGEDPNARRRPKRFAIDGAPKRAGDLAGELRVVAFLPEEVALLGEAPAARRRYLDGMIGQVDRRYRREAAELQRVLEQRNALLRRAREEGAPPDPGEIAFWDEELARLGGAVASRRQRVVAELAPHFRQAHAHLASDEGEAAMEYACQVTAGTAEDVAERYRELLALQREREMWQGVTLVGPHRDDLRVTSEGRALPTFASRGEHRTAVLALKLAEGSWMVEQTAEEPLFLLDDVLSELDPERRVRLASAIPRHAQCLITSSVPAAMPERFARDATLYAVSPGVVGAFTG